MAKTVPPPPYDPSEVFSSAMKFHATCNFLYRVDPAVENTVAAAVGIPLIAVSALTVELLLKTLHALQSTRPVPQVHNLAHLYRGLDKATRDEIQKGWEPFFARWVTRWEQMRRSSSNNPVPMKPSVESALEDGSQAFERFRYSYDLRKGNLPNYYIDDLRPVLILIILKRRPEWAAWNPRLEPLVPWEPAPEKAPSPSPPPDETHA